MLKSIQAHPSQLDYLFFVFELAFFPRYEKD